MGFWFNGEVVVARMDESPVKITIAHTNQWVPFHSLLTSKSASYSFINTCTHAVVVIVMEMVEMFWENEQPIKYWNHIKFH